jgi:hypothetical protein
VRETSEPLAGEGPDLEAPVATTRASIVARAIGVVDPVRRRWRELVGLLVACGPGLVYHVRSFVHMFPLIEYRQWIFYPWDRSAFFDLLETAFVRDHFFSRDTSLVFVAGTGAACGADVECLNAVPIGVVILTAASLYLLMLQLRPGRVAAAAVATAAWCFTYPMLEVMGWQATSHDKVGALLVTVGLNLVVWLVSRPVPRVVGLVLGNLGVLLVAVLTYSAKESAWVLMPSAVLFGLLAIARPTKAELVHRLWWAPAAVVWVLYYWVRYFRFYRNDPAARAHVSGGKPLDNLETFLAYFANRSSWDGGVRLTWALIVLGLVGAGAVAVARRTWSAPGTPRLLLWSILSFVAATVIPIRTSYASAFYLLIPTVFLYLLVFVVATSWARPAGETRSLREHTVSWAPLAWLAVLVLVLNAGFRASSGNFEQRADLSRSFTRSLELAGTYLPRDHVGPIYLVVPEERTDRHLWVGAPGARTLTPFIYGEDVVDPAFDAQLLDLTAREFLALPAREPDAWYLVFDSNLDLREVYDADALRFVATP